MVQVKALQYIVIINYLIGKQPVMTLVSNETRDNVELLHFPTILLVHLKR